MARDGSTYRGSRRNACLRERPKSVWSADWYYSRHNKEAHKAELSVGRHKRKAATSSGAVHEHIKRGDYAAATRAFFQPRTRARDRGD